MSVMSKALKNHLTMRDKCWKYEKINVFSIMIYHFVFHKKKFPQGHDLANYTPKSQFSRATYNVKRIQLGVPNVMYMYVL